MVKNMGKKKDIHKTIKYFTKPELIQLKMDYAKCLNIPESEIDTYIQNNKQAYSEWIDASIKNRFETTFKALDFPIESDIICLTSFIPTVFSRQSKKVWAYREMKRKNLNEILDIFNSDDEHEMFGTRRNICVNSIYFERRGFSIIRMWKATVSEEKRTKLKAKLFYNDISTWENIIKNTVSIYPYVKKALNW